MRNYSYKKEFLGEWMRKHGISSYALKEMLGLKSVNNIEIWAGIKPPREVKNKKADQDWMPLIHILKICNVNDLPLSMFIENAECDAEEKKPRQKSRPERKEDTVLRQEMLEMRIAHLQEKEMIRQQMKDEHDREMAELRRLMQTTIDAQQAQINIMERDLAKKENQTYIGLVADPIEKPHDKD